MFVKNAKNNQNQAGFHAGMNYYRGSSYLYISYYEYTR